MFTHLFSIILIVLGYVTWYTEYYLEQAPRGKYEQKEEYGPVYVSSCISKSLIIIRLMWAFLCGISWRSWLENHMTHLRYVKVVRQKEY